MRSGLALSVVLLLLTACGGPPATSQRPTPSPAPTVAPTPRPADLPLETPPPVSDLPADADIIEAVLDEAASISSVPREQLTVDRAEAVTWPDGGLGCPEPGMMYTQVLVDGFWIVVRAGDETFDFRGTGSNFRLCPAGTGRPPAGGVDQRI